VTPKSEDLGLQPKWGTYYKRFPKQRKKDTVYVYYMIAWYSRKNGKSYRNVMKNLGSLNESEIKYYKQSVECLNNCLEEL